MAEKVVIVAKIVERRNYEIIICRILRKNVEDGNWRVLTDYPPPL